MLSKEKIIELLATDKRAIARALILLNERQTADEQASENTRYHNGRGFRPCHARMGTSMAKFFLRNKYLTDKQIDYWRAKDKTGSMRIAIYWKQIQEEAEHKAKRPAPQPQVRQLTARDYGNDMERRMVLNEQLNDVLDSDDPALINPIAAEIDEIDAFWNRIRNIQPK